MNTITKRMFKPLYFKPLYIKPVKYPNHKITILSIEPRKRDETPLQMNDDYDYLYKQFD